MKRFKNLLLKSFLISFALLALLSAVIMTSVYTCNYKFRPSEEESNVLFIGVDETQKRVFSMTVVNVKPHKKEITFLAIPDNLWLNDDSKVLQDLYYETGIKQLRKKVENLIGAKISRYAIFDCEKIMQLVNETGEFLFSLPHSFEYEGQNISGTIILNGKKAVALLSYKEYDPSVSVSQISLSFFTTFLSENIEALKEPEKQNSIFSSEYHKDKYTNLSEKEMSEYILLLSNYSQMEHKTVNIEGEINTSSSKTFFIPSETKAKENIFK